MQRRTARGRHTHKKEDPCMDDKFPTLSAAVIMSFHGKEPRFLSCHLDLPRANLHFHPHCVVQTKRRNRRRSGLRFCSFLQSSLIWPTCRLGRTKQVGPIDVFTTNAVSVGGPIPFPPRHRPPRRELGTTSFSFQLHSAVPFQGGRGH